MDHFIAENFEVKHALMVSESIQLLMVSADLWEDLGDVFNWIWSFILLLMILVAFTVGSLVYYVTFPLNWPLTLIYFYNFSDLLEGRTFGNILLILLYAPFGLVINVFLKWIGP